jgi:Zn-finger nucleic acid-binding protein
MRTEYVSAQAELDVCDACGGLWVDWFDGEIQPLAVEAETARLDRGMPLPRPRSGVGDPRGGCPRCGRALVPELLRFSDAAEGELVSGVELHRCSECAGSFVPRPSARMLLDRVRDPRAPTLWEVFVVIVRRLVGFVDPRSDP